MLGVAPHETAALSKTGRIIAAHDGFNGGVTALCSSPDGQCLISVGGEGSIICWPSSDLAATIAGKQHATVPCFSTVPEAVSNLPDEVLDDIPVMHCSLTNEVSPLIDFRCSSGGAVRKGNL